jgi:hypothetical protein
MPVHQQGWFGAAVRIHETMLMMISHVTKKMVPGQKVISGFI